MNIVHSNSKKLFAPQLMSSTNQGGVHDFSIAVISQSIAISSGSSVTMDVYDLETTTYYGSIVQNTCNIYTSEILGDENYPFVFRSMNPTTASVDSSGTVSWLSDGIAQIHVSHDKRTKQVLFNISQETDSQFSVSKLLTGSLGYNLSSSINVTGLTASTSSYNIYTAINDTTKTYTRNPNLWSNIDMTCIPASRDGQQTGKGVLVAPDILITATHVGAGNTYYFVDKNNSTITASVYASRQITQSLIGSTDCLVVRFTNNVTGSIKPAKVFGKNIYSQSFANNFYISDGAANSLLLPVLFTNQFRTLRIGIYDGYYYGNGYFYAQCFRPEASSSLYPWYASVISGDSGNVLGTICNNEFIALTTWYGSNQNYYSYGPSISYHFDAINMAITSMGSTNLLTTASMTNFTNYP